MSIHNREQVQKDRFGTTGSRNVTVRRLEGRIYRLLEHGRSRRRKKQRQK